MESGGMIRRATVVLLSLLAVHASSDTLPFTGPAGVYTVTTGGPTRISSGAGWVLLQWDGGADVGPKPPTPVPVKPAQHSGRLTVSLIEPRYTRADIAAVRHDLAGFDWLSLDATFRGYSDGQDQVQALGFTAHYTPDDLPIVFVQETQPSGAAPIIDRIKPSSAAVVIDRVKELRGRP
jgi:hypothetical protein